MLSYPQQQSPISVIELLSIYVMPEIVLIRPQMAESGMINA